jgi:hypothetical protein
VAISLGRGALDVAGMANGDELLGVSDEIFQLDFVNFIDNLGAAIVAIGFVNFTQFAGDDLLELFIAGQNFLEFGDQLADGLQLLENFVNG